MKPRTTLLLIALACVSPFVLATLAYHFEWAGGSAGNYGELIPPKPLSGPPLDALKGKWVLVSFDKAGCDAYCERKLYFMRQTRKARGKEQPRLERLWMLTDAGTPAPALLAAIEGTRVVAPNDAFIKNFPGNPSDHIYLIDPLGNLMLRFPRDPDPKKIVKDLQRLLKYSRIG